MKFKAFGSEELPTIILLHGGGLSWWSLENVIKTLESSYHVVTPIIDGHGEDFETEFVSIEDSASKLINFIDENYRGKVYAICGLSIGGQILSEVLSKRADITEFAVIESALVYKLKTAGVMSSMYKFCYGLIKKRWFSKLQAKTLFVPNEMFENYYRDSSNMTMKTLTNITLSNGNYELKSSIKNTKSKVLVIVGEKELKVMKDRKSVV